MELGAGERRAMKAAEIVLPADHPGVSDAHYLERRATVRRLRANFVIRSLPCSKDAQPGSARS